jgi:hypothetical protein
MATPATPITPLPTPPTRDDSVNFAARADAFVAALPVFGTETNALAVNVYNNALDAFNDSVSAATSESNAAISASAANASAQAAAISANVTLWVSGTTYTSGQTVYSPITFLTYRRITNGAGTTDPSADSVNWQLISGDVIGPSSSTNNAVVRFDGVTGKIVKNTAVFIDDAGNLGVGGDTTGVVAGTTVTSKFCVKNQGTEPLGGFVHANNSAATSGAGVFACRSRGTLTAPTVVQNNDRLASIFIAGHDGTDLALSAQIDFEVDGAPGSNDMPGRIIFKTTPNNTQTPTEALRLKSDQTALFAGVVESAAGGFKFPDGTTQASAASGLPEVEVVSGTTQSAVKSKHYVLTNAAATTVTLPSSPSAGDTVWVTVANGLTTNVIARNSANIQSIAEDLTLNATYAAVQLRYADATRGWVFI